MLVRPLGAQGLQLEEHPRLARAGEGQAAEEVGRPAGEALEAWPPRDARMPGPKYMAV